MRGSTGSCINERGSRDQELTGGKEGEERTGVASKRASADEEKRTRKVRGRVYIFIVGWVGGPSEGGERVGESEEKGLRELR